MKLAGAFLTCVTLTASQPTTPASSPKLVYATYLGTGANSVANTLAVDSAGYSYVGGAGPSFDNATCAFLTKLNPLGTAAVWTICLPARQVDDVAIDTSGFIYVIGLNSPLFSTALTSRVMKLTPDAQQVIYSIQIAGAYGKIST